MSMPYEMTVVVPPVTTLAGCLQKLPCTYSNRLPSESHPTPRGTSAQVLRDVPTLVSRAGSQLSSAAVFAGIYWRMGLDESTIQDRTGLLQVGTRVSLKFGLHYFGAAVMWSCAAVGWERGGPGAWSDPWQQRHVFDPSLECVLGAGLMPLFCWPLMPYHAAMTPAGVPRDFP